MSAELTESSTDGPSTPRNPESVALTRRRTTVLLFVFFLWACLIVLRLSQFMIFERDDQLQAMNRQAVFEGQIASIRGRLLDRTGRPLAWSTRHLAVHWQVPPHIEDAQHAWQALQSHPELIGTWTWDAARICLGREIVLRRDVGPTAMGQIEALEGQVRGLQATSYFVRHRIHHPEVKELLGGVHTIAGSEVGTSGAEETHDTLLRGLPGRYRVLLDRSGEWIPGTWRRLSELRPGYDVYLPIRVEQGGRDPT